MSKYIDNSQYLGFYSDDEIELITDYQPITPKVGGEYRVLKDGHHFEKGRIITINRRDKDGQWWPVVGPCLNGSINYLITEYLDLVEEGKEVFTGTGFRLWSETHPEDFTKEPIKKTLIQKTMNAFKKALLSADTKTLIKAGYMDSETLELTSKGQDALNFINYEKYQKELVASAKAVIDEEEAKKK